MGPWQAVAVTVLAWWASTGVILFAVRWADRLGGRAHLAMTIGAFPLLLLGWAGLLISANDTGPLAPLTAFLSALAIWGWFELAFLCGVITGPIPRPCPPNVPGWERFLRAWGTLAYSEIALLVTATGLVIFAANSANPFGVWTFLILLFARVSAKLNLYLGVPNINTEFLPVPMRHLASHFRIAPGNALFPVSITLLTFSTSLWIGRFFDQDPGSAAAAGFALLATLNALALLEHWLMILPLPDEKLWRWLLPDAASDPRPDAATNPRPKRRRI
ncbi:MAG: putative photosynthetic complex assembly protein PuhE [Pseudomonadota bacterium]